jgi:acyl carrier protein
LIERDDREPPIGQPIANTQAYLLDGQMRPVPIGVPGELYLGGDGLARGYLNRPDLTAERFIPDPFSRGAPCPEGTRTGTRGGARLYRTGDLARFLPGGTIAFLGRIDHQVKIRGFRIELGEIEAALAQHETVQDCAVIVHSDDRGNHLLVAYVVENKEQPSNEQPELDAQALRQYLQARLPEYMVPSAFVLLPALPLTPNGKLDRRALPLPDGARPDLGAEFVAPRTPLEATLVNIWSQLLGIERVGIHDNFFHLGGHSLLVTQLVVRLRETLQLELPVHSLFETPTIAALATRIEMLRWAAQAPSASSDDLDEDLEEGTL